jgi:hypothetical protein
MADASTPGDDETVVGRTVYRRGLRVRLRGGLDGPDAGMEGRTGTIEAIHQGDTGPVFLAVAVDPEPGTSGEPLRHVFVAPSQVDLTDD